MKIFDDQIARFFAVPAMRRNDFHRRNLGGKGLEEPIASYLSLDAGRAGALAMDQLQGQARPPDNGVDKSIMTVAAHSVAQRDRAEIDTLITQR